MVYPAKGQKTALVLGASGFIGSHLVARLKQEGYFVHAVDITEPRYWAFRKIEADEIEHCDLRNRKDMIWKGIVGRFDEVYQLAADMGGMGYIGTGLHDAQILHNSALINLNVLELVWHNSPDARVFFSSSACVARRGCA